MMENHGHVRNDTYNAIKTDRKWQKRIIQREEKNFKKWAKLTWWNFD